MQFQCVERQIFDSDVFGTDFFRVVAMDAKGLDADLDKIRSLKSYIVDAKTVGSDFWGDRYFQARGFKKVCVLIRFARDVEPDDAALNAAPEAVFEDRMPDKDLARHVRNLKYDRFNLDGDIRTRDRDEFQLRWMTNSMRSARIYKVYEDTGFCSFKPAGEEIVVDIFSVLTHRRGVGSRLMDRLKAFAAGEGFKRVNVFTESENEPACRFYEKNGFRIHGSFSCFHLVKY